MQTGTLTNQRPVDFISEHDLFTDINLEILPALSRPQSAISLLEKFGYTPKVFCYANPQNQELVFEVMSNKWNWLVSPLTADSLRQIPPKFLNAITILHNHNINFNAVAIAKPKPKEDLFDILIHEAKRKFKALVNLFTGLLVFLASIFKVSLNGLSSASRILVTPKLVDIPDPVLLIKQNSIWIEIGRWE